MTSAIEIENVAKLYRLGMVGTGTLSHDLNRWWHRVRGLEDPYSKVGQVNDRSQVSSMEESKDPEYVWALKGVDLRVSEGEILGIIGRNGAGKSTLLKLLSRVTSPTSGVIRARGRVASLLEVGTGMHPELTGRENIYLNGAILGMKRAEISARLDSIVDFSACGKYLDTPVKRYSSGMMVRLGFAVAAHLESEILIVDEVLAVGDAEFQKSCVGKMKSISSGQGRTVLVVSHNMGTIASLCDRAVLLHQGMLEQTGPPDEIVLAYLNETGTTGAEFVPETPLGDGDVRLVRAWVEDEAGDIEKGFEICEPFRVCMEYEILRDLPDAPYANFHFFDSRGEYAFVSAGKEPLLTRAGVYKATCHIPESLLNDGAYRIGVAATSTHRGLHVHFFEPDALMVSMSEPLMENLDGNRLGYAGKIPGPVRPQLKWTIGAEETP